ncbi:MAG: hypothetical protein K5653_10020 [Clostridiales bacterium]|nr:hypothetical protein [Clostridiales bacterium]
MKTKRKLFTLLLAVMMVVTMMPLGASQGYAADSLGKQQYDNVMKASLPNSILDENYNPYGFDVGVPFNMNVQSEILFYLMNGDISSNGGDITTFYDTLKKGNTEDIFKGADKTSAMKNPPVDLRKASFVQAVSFDPRGIGRKDHIAFIGVNANKYAYVWVYDTRNKKWYRTNGDNGGFSIVRCSWMDSQEPSEYEAANFLSITAGDYDNDGKETLIVYAVGDYIDDDTYRYQLYELQVDSPDIGGSGSISIDYRKTARSFIWSYKYANQKDNKYRLGCDLATGDINGDGIDDLASVSYYGDIRNSNQKASFYRPYLCVYYGEPGKNIFRQVGSSVGLWEGYSNESDDNKIKNKKWKSMVSPGIACGDIDNDGVDEIVTAGIKNTIEANGAANAANSKDIDKYNLSVYIVDDGKLIQEEVSANEWTTNGFYVDDEVWNKTAVETVAISGMGNPEMVFISGTLYDYDGKRGSLTAVETPGYFKNAGDNLEFKASTNMFINSTAAGNFDGNDKGFEQVAFTVSCKTQSKENYDYLMGVIGGKNHNDRSGIASGYYSTSKGSMDDDNSYPRRVDQSNRAGGISENNGLNCIAIAVDSDNDGMLVRYKDKSFTMADPDVLCVLQTPPVFKELQDYTGVGSTGYTIKNSYSFEKSETSSSSFSVGGNFELGTPACQIEVQAGYAREMSTEFTTGYENEESHGWETDGADKVIIYRTPVVLYNYQVQDQNGNWEVDGKENIRVIAVPEKPSYTTMSIEQYNAFAKYYNKETAKISDDFRELGILNNKWLGHPGEPDKYISSGNTLFNTAGNGYELMQKTTQSVDHDPGSSSWSLEQGTSSSVTESIEHGYTFETSVGFGPDLGPVSFSVGVNFSLENMSGESTTTSTAEGTGIEGSVPNIPDENIPAELKPGSFSLAYRMATWPSGLKNTGEGGKTNSVPVYGYAVSGVYNPLKSGDLTKEEIEALPVIDLIDSLEDSTIITLDDEDEIRYIRDEYEKLSEEAKKLVDITFLIIAEEKIRIIKEYETGQPMNIDGWVIGLSKTSFTYNGKVQKPVVKSIWGFPLEEGKDYDLEWSNASSKNAGTYTVKAIGKGRYNGTATGEYKILPKKITPKVTLSAKTYTFNGKVRKPTVTVKNGTTKLSSSNYRVTYGPGRKSIGKYEVKVTMKGNYSGTKSVYFSIIPKGTTISSITPASKSITVNWKKQATRMATFRIQGYQIQIATNSSFTKGADKWVAYGYSKTSKKLTGLKSGKKYYVRIRTFKGVNGVKYFSKWSKVKTVTTKK